MPYIRYLLAVDPGDRRSRRWIAAAAARAHLRRVRALVALRAAQRRPTVLVFEDLHWIDSSTEEYLASLVDAVADASDPADRAPTASATRRAFGRARATVTTLTLRSLSEAETLAMAGPRARRRRACRASCRRRCSRRREGVPLFIEEVAKTHARPRRSAARRAASIAWRKRVETSRFPTRIEGIIMARLDRLGEDGKRTVQLASVIGRQFPRARCSSASPGCRGSSMALLAELKRLRDHPRAGPAARAGATCSSTPSFRTSPTAACCCSGRKELHRAVGARHRGAVRRTSAPSTTASSRTTSRTASCGRKACSTPALAGDQRGARLRQPRGGGLLCASARARPSGCEPPRGPRRVRGTARQARRRADRRSASTTPASRRTSSALAAGRSGGGGPARRGRGAARYGRRVLQPLIGPEPAQRYCDAALVIRRRRWTIAAVQAACCDAARRLHRRLAGPDRRRRAAPGARRSSSQSRSTTRRCARER